MGLKPAAFFLGREALDDAAAAVQTDTIGRVLGLQREERRAAGGAERVAAEASIEIGNSPETPPLLFSEERDERRRQLLGSPSVSLSSKSRSDTKRVRERWPLWGEREIGRGVVRSERDRERREEVEGKGEGGSERLLAAREH